MFLAQIGKSALFWGQQEIFQMFLVATFFLIVYYHCAKFQNNLQGRFCEQYEEGFGPDMGCNEPFETQ